MVTPANLPYLIYSTMPSSSASVDVCTHLHQPKGPRKINLTPYAYFTSQSTVISSQRRSKKKDPPIARKVFQVFEILILFIHCNLSSHKFFSNLNRSKINTVAQITSVNCNVLLTGSHRTKSL